MKQTILSRSIRSLLLVPVLLGSVAFAQETKMPALRVDSAELKRDENSSYAPVIEKTAQSVVTIETKVRGVRNARGQRGLSDPFFRKFFGLPDMEEEDAAPKKAPEKNGKLMPAGLGSGVIVSADGYILTNHHVVDGADEITVTLADGKTTHTAKKIASDKGSDIAVIKVEAKDLTPITFADSSKAKVGDVAIAIGCPFALGQSVTKGIISALGRTQRSISEYADFIQTDASINPGNSGGALVDAQGRLVGVPTAIYSRSGGNMGIGFAVPSNQARSVMESLLKFGKVQRGFLGIGMTEITPQLAKSFGLKDTDGLIVTEVVPQSAADKAGIKNEDVIVSLDGKKFENADSFRNTIASQLPGAKIELKVIRDAKEMTVSVTLADRDGSTTVSTDSNHKSDKHSEKVPDVLDGVQVGDITNDYRQRLRIDESVKGAIVTSVDPDSACAEADLKAGDVIVSINGKDVKNAEAAVTLSEEVKTLSTVRLRVHRAGQTRFVIVEERKEH
jgi:serine protease Do